MEFMKGKDVSGTEPGQGAGKILLLHLTQFLHGNSYTSFRAQVRNAFLWEALPDFPGYLMFLLRLGFI